MLNGHSAEMTKAAIESIVNSYNLDKNKVKVYQLISIRKKINVFISFF